MELKDKVYQKIVELCEDGNVFIEKGDFNKAIDKYSEALKLIPEPKYDWEASTWIYTALGDSCYQIPDYNKAINYFFETLKCPNGLGNPFVLLRIGECFYELKNKDKAKEYLLQAYMCGGEDVFFEENDKYFKLINTVI